MATITAVTLTPHGTAFLSSGPFKDTYTPPQLRMHVNDERPASLDHCQSHCPPRLALPCSYDKTQVNKRIGFIISIADILELSFGTTYFAV